jgi:hypothetical protein
VPISEYEQCREARQYWLRSEGAKARAKSEHENVLPPHLRYWTKEAEAAIQGAETAMKAHKIGKCTCGIRDQIDRQNNRQKIVSQI